MNILNVYQILRTLNKVKDNINPKVFDKIFEEIQLKYQSRYSKINFEKPKATPKTTDIATFPRGVHIWNNYLEVSEKLLLFFPLFF